MKHSVRRTVYVTQYMTSSMPSMVPAWRDRSSSIEWRESYQAQARAAMPRWTHCQSRQELGKNSGVTSEFSQGAHICALYETEDEQLSIAAVYIADGLRQGER